jgi:hypothetical protein
MLAFVNSPFMLAFVSQAFRATRRICWPTAWRERSITAVRVADNESMLFDSEGSLGSSAKLRHAQGHAVT